VVLIVGLTGGIGSGKSTVAQLLAERGAWVVDADQAARVVVAPGMPALDAIVERFGPEVLDADGRLDRTALGRLVFADDAARSDLERITHDHIAAEMVRRIGEAPPDAVVVCDVPLMAEKAAARARYPFVIVVEAPREVRLARLEARGLPRADAEARMAAQVSDETRRKVANIVIDNSGNQAALDRQVDDLWTELQQRNAE
jgi:dephospho-CoA kinase